MGRCLATAAPDKRSKAARYKRASPEELFFGKASRVFAVLGAQWGDEGKGKLVDILAPHYDVIARFNGGSNAGNLSLRACTASIHPSTPCVCVCSLSCRSYPCGRWQEVCVSSTP